MDGDGEYPVFINWGGATSTLKEGLEDVKLGPPCRSLCPGLSCLECPMLIQWIIERINNWILYALYKHKDESAGYSFD